MSGTMMNRSGRTARSMRYVNSTVPPEGFWNVIMYRANEFTSIGIARVGAVVVRIIRCGVAAPRATMTSRLLPDVRVTATPTWRVSPSPSWLSKDRGRLKPGRRDSTEGGALRDPSIAACVGGTRRATATAIPTTTTQVARDIEFLTIRNRWLSFRAYLTPRLRKNI